MVVTQVVTFFAKKNRTRHLFFLREICSPALSAARGRDPKRGEFSKRAFSEETSET
jgi:hypothetical protein